MTTENKNQLILLKIRNLIISKEFEVSKANRENNLGGWLSNHEEAIQFYDNEINNLEKELE